MLQLSLILKYSSLIAKEDELVKKEKTIGAFLLRTSVLYY